MKGLGKEQIVNSVVRIHTEGVEGGEGADEMGTGLRIRQVEDRWDGEIPDGPIAKVCGASFLDLFGLFWWWGLFWVLLGEVPA